MTAMELNVEGIQALRKLGEDSLHQVPSDAVLKAVASCELFDLDMSIARHYEAKDKAKFHRNRIKQLEKELKDLCYQLKESKNQLRVQVARAIKFEAVSPLNDATDIVIVLFSFIREVQDAVSCARSYVKGRTSIDFYYLAFLERFVLPALEGHLTSEWSADNMWATVDRQITQRLPWRNKDSGEAPWMEVFADIKKNLIPEQLRVLVGGVCASEQCDADQLKSLIAQLREKAKAEKWPAEYVSQ